MGIYLKVKEVRQGDNVFVFDDNLKTRGEGNDIFLNLQYFGFNQILKEEKDAFVDGYLKVNYENLEINFENNNFPIGVLQMYFLVDFDYLFESEREQPNSYSRTPTTKDYILFDSENESKIYVYGHNTLTSTTNGTYALRCYNTAIAFATKNYGFVGNNIGMISGCYNSPDNTNIYPGFGDKSASQYKINDFFSESAHKFGLYRSYYPFCIRASQKDKITTYEDFLKILELEGTNSDSFASKVNSVITPLQLSTHFGNSQNTEDLKTRYNNNYSVSGRQSYLAYAQKEVYDWEREGRHEYNNNTVGTSETSRVAYPPFNNTIGNNNNINRWLEFFKGIKTVETIPGTDTEGPNSGTGGGGGNFDNSSDNITVPTLPSTGALDTGFVTMYRMSSGTMNQLRNVLWTSDFVENIYKLFNDPAEAIVSMQITYAPLSAGVAQNVIIGNYQTSISAQKVTEQFYKLDCGTINIKEYWGNFLDYSPNTDLSIYLPFIGIRPLDINNFMNGTIHVVYHIDAVTGNCVALVSTIKDDIDSIIYTYSGNCNIQIPWTSKNFLDWQLKMVETGLSLAGTAYSVGTGVSAMTPYTMGSLATATANSVVREHSNVTKGGSMTSNNGVLSIKYPFLILNRPIQSLPKNYNKYGGYPSNITSTLSDLKGFTKVSDIHLDNVFSASDSGSVYATNEEKKELENLLKQGIII